jgi:hypothetical protein
VGSHIVECLSRWKLIRPRLCCSKCIYRYYYYGLLQCVNIHAVYILGISRKILLSLMCVFLLYGHCVFVARFSIRTKPYEETFNRLHDIIFQKTVLFITTAMRTSNSTSVFLAYFPYFEKLEIGLCDLHSVCLWIPPPIRTSECLNQSSWILVCTSWYLTQSQWCTS